MHLKPNPEDNGVITKEFLKKLCKTDFKNYYSTPSLNDILYLHYKGFTSIAGLEEYTGLKVLYMEGNAFRKIQGFQQLTMLRCLYLQENLICKIQGLETLTQLVNLNLSDNLIEKVQGLSTLTKLSNLQVKRNRIGGAGLDDVRGLLECPSISALDISDNKIDQQEFLGEILEKLPNIAVIYMQNNQFTKKISHYRKTVISRIPTIKYIDDKPVFEDELRFSQAWARGGLEQERQQRARYKKQKEDEQLRQHQQFRKMLQRYKEEGQREKARAESSQSDSEINSHNESLQTYKTPQDSSQPSDHNSASVPSERDSSKNPSQKDLSDRQVSEKAQSQKAASQKSRSEKGQQSDHQQSKQRQVTSQVKMSCASYLDELD